MPTYLSQQAMAPTHRVACQMAPTHRVACQMAAWLNLIGTIGKPGWDFRHQIDGDEVRALTLIGWTS